MDPTVSKLKFDRELDGLRAFAPVVGDPWNIRSAEWPSLHISFRHPRSQRSVGFAFAFDEWDDLPPSLALFDPETGATLSWDRWPQGSWSAANAHPSTGKPFLCLPGIREYHTHSSHLNDAWENYRARGTYSLPYIIHRVWQKFGVSDG
jgi:hypothetical protein